MKYRKKPVVIDAIVWTGANADEIKAFTQGGCYLDVNDATRPVLKIRTLEDDMSASWGDFIIRGVKGEYYACKPDIFEMTYEPA